MEVSPIRYAKSGEVHVAYQMIGDGPMDLVFVPGFVSHLEMMMEEPALARFARRLASFARLIAFDKRGTGLSDRYPWGTTPEDLRRMADHLEPRWGTGVGLGAWAPSMARDRRMREWWARFQRLAASPAAAVAQIVGYADLDVRGALPAVTAPALVLHRTGDRMIEVGAGRDLAEHLPGARFVELSGQDHLFWTGDQDAVLDEVEEFLIGTRSGASADRVLATVLFTDIVGSTEKAVELGDHQWRVLLDAHDSLVRRELERFRGREVKTTGDGFLASFDGPARAINCARALTEGARSLGLELRAGIHAGECEVRGDDLGGFGVHLAARVGATAAPGEVLVSSTVKDLVAGSGITFAERGVHELKGIPGEWRLHAVSG